jgi:hypothetical protein
VRISSVVSFAVFVLVFMVSREATRRALEAWVALEGVVLWGASFAASLALAALASGAVLHVARLLGRD